MLLRLEGVTRSFGGRDLFRGATLGVDRNDRTAVRQDLGRSWGVDLAQRSAPCRV